MSTAELSARSAAHEDEFVKDARKRLKLTQAQLAEKIGLERRSIMRYEQGDELPLKVRLAIMHLLSLQKQKRQQVRKRKEKER